jgi:hypothetical protein
MLCLWLLWWSIEKRPLSFKRQNRRHRHEVDSIPKSLSKLVFPPHIVRLDPFRHVEIQKFGR